MADRPHDRAARVARGALAAVVVAGAAVSILPLVETDAWWIRYLDFVRLQVAVALVAALGLHAALGGWRRRTGLAVLALGLAAVGLHAWRLYPYSGVVTPMAEEVTDCAAPSQVRVMVANVQRGNHRAEELFAIVARAEPDLLLLLETNERWDRTLQALHPHFAHRVQHVPRDATHYGMHLMSRHPLVAPEVAFYFGADTPTILTGVALPDGSELWFVGLHPRPPMFWDQPTTMRDAHLLEAALAARGSERPSVLAGDFNATPWERVSRRAMRIGGLLDPRVGRGVFPTYDAQSLLMSWPLDQVLFQDSFGLGRWEVLPAFGSDHLPVLAELCLRPDLAATQSAPALGPRDLEEAEATLRAAQVMRR